MMINTFSFWLVNYAIGIASVLFGMASLFITSENRELFEMIAVAGAGSLLFFWFLYIAIYLPPLALVPI